MFLSSVLFSFPDTVIFVSALVASEHVITFQVLRTMSKSTYRTRRFSTIVEHRHRCSPPSMRKRKERLIGEWILSIVKNN
jgi:hypothetical protein